MTFLFFLGGCFTLAWSALSEKYYCNTPTGCQQETEDTKAAGALKPVPDNLRISGECPHVLKTATNSLSAQQ